MKKCLLAVMITVGLVGLTVRGAVKDWEEPVLKAFPELPVLSPAVQNSCRGLEANKELGQLLRSAQAKKLTDWSKEVVMLAYLDYWRISFKKAAVKMEAAGDALRECSQAVSEIMTEFPEVQREWLGDLGQGSLERDWRDLLQFMKGEPFDYRDERTGEIKVVRALAPPRQVMPELADLLAERARQYRFVSGVLKQYIGQQQGFLAAHIKAGH